MRLKQTLSGATLCRLSLAPISLSATLLLSPTALAKSVRPVTAAGSSSSQGGFFLDRLPFGKDVTIPRPATTYVPLLAKVRFTATDIPQTLSFRAVNLHSGPVAPLRLAIYTEDSQKAKYVDIKPGTPFLYNFKELSSITVVTETQGSAESGLQLQVESDKPLEIAH